MGNAYMLKFFLYVFDVVSVDVDTVTINSLMKAMKSYPKIPLLYVKIVE